MLKIDCQKILYFEDVEDRPWLHVRQKILMQCFSVKYSVLIVSRTGKLFVRCLFIRFMTIPEMHHNNMSTGSGFR